MSRALLVIKPEAFHQRDRVLEALDHGYLFGIDNRVIATFPNEIFEICYQSKQGKSFYEPMRRDLVGKIAFFGELTGTGGIYEPEFRACLKDMFDTAGWIRDKETGYGQNGIHLSTSPLNAERELAVFRRVLVTPPLHTDPHFFRI